MKKTKTQKGITLIALIITIVVLLILAVVTINAIQGDGIIRYAKNATSDYKVAQEIEELKLAVLEYKMQSTTQDDANLKEFLIGKYGAERVQENSDGSVTVTMESGDKYIATANGEVTLLDESTNPPTEGGNEGDTPTPPTEGGNEGNTPIIHNGTIPEGATYYSALDSKTYVAGEAMPTSTKGDIYTFEDYKYCYGYTWDPACGSWSYECCYNETDGWAVGLNDRTLNEYGEILTTINGVNITSLFETFMGCTNLTTAPAIPSSVTDMCEAFTGCGKLTTIHDMSNIIDVNMYYTFSGCTSLTDLSEFKLPTKLGSMEDTFSGCTSLTYAPTIPNSVTEMRNTFNGCSALKTAPVIPSSVMNMEWTFCECTALSDSITINSTPTSFEGCLGGVHQVTEILGDCDEEVKAAILETKNDL